MRVKPPREARTDHACRSGIRPVAVLVLAWAVPSNCEISGLAARAKRTSRFCRGGWYCTASGYVVSKATPISMSSTSDPCQHVVSTQPSCWVDRPPACSPPPPPAPHQPPRFSSVDDVLKRQLPDWPTTPHRTATFLPLHPACEPVCGYATAWITKYIECYPSSLNH